MIQMQLRFSLTLIALSLAGAVAAAAAGNSVTIKELTGTTQTNRPFTVSRVFAQGDIANYAQARVNGNPVLTQCDVKSRWPDGSLKHALVSFNATLSAGSTVTVDFVNQASGNNSSGLGQAAMLSFNESSAGAADGWGAAIQAVASGIQKTADARSMLKTLSLTGNFDSQQVRYWMQGPVVTQVIVEDRSPSRSFDFGWTCTSGCSGDYASAAWASDTNNRSLHPIFILTFYQNFPGVKVDFIVEDDWTTALQDQRYALTLRSGGKLQNARYTKTFTHYARTRWRKTFWDGAMPGEVKIDYNLPYMISTKTLPNFDPSVPVSSATANSELSAFLATDQGDINGYGEYVQYFPQTGQTTSPPVGIMPRWQARYLYGMANSSIKNELLTAMLGNADVSGHIPIHYRESLTRGFFRDANNDDVADMDTPFGRMLSIDARPTVRTSNLSDGSTNSADRIVPVTSLSNSHGWSVDLAHQPAFTYVPYLVTGDWYYLEELYAWSGFNLAFANPGTEGYSRHGTWGYISQANQMRGQAWALRTVAQAAALAPDTAPEKAYLTQKINNNIAVFEGRYNVTSGVFYSACTSSPYNPNSEKSKWCWGRNSVGTGPSWTGAPATSPLGDLNYGDPTLCNSSWTSGSGLGCIQPWEEYFFYSVWGHVNELGFNTSKILADRSKLLIGKILDPSYNPYLLDVYAAAVMDASGQYLSSWSAVKSYSLSNTRTSWNGSGGPSDYAHIAMAATSYAYPFSYGSYQGSAAWTWLASHIIDTKSAEDPKWAFLPRGGGQTGGGGNVAISQCDVNADGTVNMVDVQLSINQALGSSSCGSDLDSNGTCDVVDVQRVTNAALGSTCRLGP